MPLHVSVTEDAATQRLREQVERALARGQSQRVIEPLVERLVRVAPRGSESASFAHRLLAEYRVQQHPWRALLHLREVGAAHPEDDSGHALAGLAHALLGNFRSAVAAYRRALDAAPGNPWYHHNVGHLLDVALDEPRRAQPHLLAAYEALGDDEAEIASSYVACLLRGNEEHRARAIRVLEEARAAHPKHKGLSEMARTLAPSEPSRRPRAPASSPPPARATKKASSVDSSEEQVIALLRAQLGGEKAYLRAAEALCRRYLAARAAKRARAASPAVLAAAVACAVMPQGETHVRDVARVFGGSPRSVASRLEEIRETLREG